MLAFNENAAFRNLNLDQLLHSVTGVTPSDTGAYVSGRLSSGTGNAPNPKFDRNVLSYIEDKARLFNRTSAMNQL